MGFGPPFGRRYVVPMFLEEMRALPQLCPGLADTGFLVGGFNWFVDWLALPLGYAAMRLAPRRALRPTARAMLWGLRRFTRPPYGTLRRLEATGIRDGAPAERTLTVAHADGYWLTAIPVAAPFMRAGAARATRRRSRSGPR
jgi:saccharopine dehydrogenase (NAD+, L-lysine-forming)